MRRGGGHVRVVADTNTLVSGVLWTGKPAVVLELALRGKIEHFTSKYILEETEEVLRRPKFAKRLAAIRRRVPAVMRDLRDFSTVVSPADLMNASRDPDDDVVLATAMSAKAKAIVSRDKDLLILKKFRGISIFNSAEFLERYFPNILLEQE